MVALNGALIEVDVGFQTSEIFPAALDIPRIGWDTTQTRDWDPTQLLVTGQHRPHGAHATDFERQLAPHRSEEVEMATQSSTKTNKKSLEPASDESILDTIHATQAASVDVAKQWVDSVGEIIPDLWEKPIASGVPAIHQIADAAFDLTRNILDAQRDFAKRIVDSVVGEARKLD
jgi:hypothetical protein